MSNPGLDDSVRLALVDQLMAARRAVRTARLALDDAAESAAHAAVDIAKQKLGERGPVWWSDGAPDFNRHMARHTPYAEWYAGLSPHAT
jgi:hypothetical protein